METFELPNGHLGTFLRESFQELARRQAALLTLQTLQTKIAPVEKFLGHFGFQFILHGDPIPSSLEMRLDSNDLEAGDDQYHYVTSYYDPSMQRRGFFVQGKTGQEINASVTKTERPGLAQFQFSLSQSGKPIREGESSEAIIRDLAATLGRISPAFLERAKQAWKKTLPLAGELDKPDVRRAPGFSPRITELAAAAGVQVELRR